MNESEQHLYNVIHRRVIDIRERSRLDPDQQIVELTRLRRFLGAQITEIVAVQGQVLSEALNIPQGTSGKDA